mmetsp:Transcript_7131/g.22015  ORF Transcript_7131/g.22015 Transcript_7131/m.22015 type:complete len:211 (-) Transcript_7131:1863-2495(-)
MLRSPMLSKRVELLANGASMRPNAQRAPTRPRPAFLGSCHATLRRQGVRLARLRARLRGPVAAARLTTVSIGPKPLHAAGGAHRFSTGAIVPPPWTSCLARHVGAAASVAHASAAANENIAPTWLPNEPQIAGAALPCPCQRHAHASAPRVVARPLVPYQEHPVAASCSWWMVSLRYGRRTGSIHLYPARQQTPQQNRTSPWAILLGSER